MRNCYKREDVFVCRHDAHRRFDHRVSAYHVLREKRCYPSGCVSFIWKCKRLDKGGRCPKGYRHVGSNCTQCRFYDEEKVHRRPEMLLDAAGQRQFEREWEDFEAWLEDHLGHAVTLGGEISDVRPHLVKRRDAGRTSIFLRGFLVRLLPAYVELTGFDDALYVGISRAQQGRHRLAVGDRIELEGRLKLDRGRLVGADPRRMRVELRAGQPAAAWDRALLDRVGAVTLEDQAERCLRCERGVLVDVEDVGRPRAVRRRELLCLEGIGRPQDCPFEALREMRQGVTTIGPQ